MFIGIDPGIRGGVAIIYEGMGNCVGLELPTYKDGTKSRIDAGAFRTMLIDLVNQCNGIESISIAIEKVSAMPNQGVTSMFNFGFTYGVLTGICHLLSNNIHHVHPKTWKKSVLSKDHTKQGSIDFVENNYPEVQLLPQGKKIPHDGIADAVCIAHYLTITV